MNDTIRLITEIVILISAIIGVYKVATSKPEVGGVSMKSEKREWPDMLKMIGTYFGVYVFMFVPMIFILLMSWFTKLMNTVNSPSSTRPSLGSLKIEIAPDKLSDNGRLAYFLFQAGSSAGSSWERDKILSSAVDFAIQSNEFQIALAAAQSIEASSTKDEKLRTVMRAALKSGALEVGVKSIQSMAASSEQDSAGAEFAASVINWGRHLQSKNK
ncbi:hypothetical protein [Geothrix sp. SG200]|uniref:hypothetical protein n=1 Tax=Geothrix sp. SG200 TaxID=2922865 RepID=UPI001FAB97BA|nr:hypothetical protein [Geothrix sp. SG200]